MVRDLAHLAHCLRFCTIIFRYSSLSEWADNAQDWTARESISRAVQLGSGIANQQRKLGLALSLRMLRDTLTTYCQKPKDSDKCVLPAVTPAAALFTGMC